MKSGNRNLLPDLLLIFSYTINRNGSSRYFASACMNCAASAPSLTR